jgi:hypothetical protein
MLSWKLISEAILLDVTLSERDCAKRRFLDDIPGISYTLAFCVEKGKNTINLATSTFIYGNPAGNILWFGWL